TKERAMTLSQMRQELSQRLGREPTVGELAEATGLEPEDIAAADTAVLTVASLQSETGEDGFSLEAVLGDEGIEDELVEKLTLRQAIDALPERERMVILLRFYKNLTQDRVSKVLGVSQVQVSRIERRAVAKLREALTE
ncbi:MAG: sigma-70 family RNA polymerase sigma factor, partial [Oscillospiraceae bacterium]|nr:sigma-70 family RNA polymerase sigma factor [Oscillospiraceae bacterium]